MSAAEILPRLSLQREIVIESTTHRRAGHGEGAADRCTCTGDHRRFREVGDRWSRLATISSEVVHSERFAPDAAQRRANMGYSMSNEIESWPRSGRS